MIMNWIRLALSKPVRLRAIKVAALVGPVLIGINQGDIILQGGLNVICVLKMGLTFMVPYCVSTFSSVEALKDCSTDMG